MYFTDYRVRSHNRYLYWGGPYLKEKKNDIFNIVKTKKKMERNYPLC